MGKIEIMSGNRVDGVGVIISNCFFVGSTGRVGAVVVSKGRTGSFVGSTGRVGAVIVS